MQELKAEIQDLRTQLKGNCSNFLPVSSLMLESRRKPQHTSPKDTPEVIKDSEIQALRKQIHQLQQQFAVMTVGQSS